MQEENQNNQENNGNLRPVQLTEISSLSAPTSIAEARRDYAYGHGTAPEGRQMHLRDYWRIVRRRLWIPISTVFVMVTLMTIYMLRAPSIYEGKATLQIDSEQKIDCVSSDNSGTASRTTRIVTEYCAGQGAKDGIGR